MRLIEPFVKPATGMMDVFAYIFGGGSEAPIMSARVPGGTTSTPGFRGKRVVGPGPGAPGTSYPKPPEPEPIDPGGKKRKRAGKTFRV